MALLKITLCFLLATLCTALGPKFNEEITLYFIPYTTIEPKPDQTIE